MKILVDGTLLIPNLIPEDAGNYTCIPTNGILTPPTASAQLTVKRKGLIRSLTHYLISVILFRGVGGLITSLYILYITSIFFSCSSNSDPARVGRMSRETYLPAGMEGVIVCPVQADPPVLYVNWTKDGNDLNPDNVNLK